MVLFNYATRELTAKIVYYGPGLCGKTTNLEHIHRSLPDKTRGKMLSLATQTDRTLFFDFLPIDLGSVKGMKTRIQLYTVPGQVFYDATRKLVLKGADGVVFVADSQKELFESNLESWENLKQNLAENNLDINTIPMVIQYNKLDLPNILPVKELNRRINVVKAPYFESIAVQGVGVQETLKGIAKLVLQTLSRRYGREEPAATQEKRATEILSGQKQERETSERLQFAFAGNVAATPSPTINIGMDEEVKELPPVAEELDATEDAPLSLEPIEESPTLGELEDVPEFQDVAELRPDEETDMPSVEAVTADVKSAYVEKPQVRISGNAEAEVAVNQNSIAVANEPAELNVPFEISVKRGSEEVKLQISINLKIKFDRD